MVRQHRNPAARMEGEDNMIDKIVELLSGADEEKIELIYRFVKRLLL